MQDEVDVEPAGRPVDPADGVVAHGKAAAGAGVARLSIRVEDEGANILLAVLWNVEPNMNVVGTGEMFEIFAGQTQSLHARRELPCVSDLQGAEAVGSAGGHRRRPIKVRRKGPPSSVASRPAGI